VTPPAARSAELTKTYGTGTAAVNALRGVTLEIDRAKFTAIMGPSGSGKSSLLHCMAGLDRPTSGKVFIGETDLTALSEKKLTVFRRNHVGFIFQAYNLLPTLTAKENIELPSRISRRSPDGDWMNNVLTVLGLGDRLTHRPSELSGGEQQRVAAARALGTKPEVIFADEPTGNLDSVSSAQLLDFMRQSVDEYEQTIVMVTHDAQAASRSDRVVFLADGQVRNEMTEPTYERVLDRMKSLVN
jgi:putative ABC transport system ATP-binding protein